MQFLVRHQVLKIVSTFLERAPSTTWEPVSLSPDGTLVIWVWFKPPHAPTSAALRLPLEVWQHRDASQALTVRRLAAAVHIDWLQSWMVFGQLYPVDERTAALWDVPIPSPPAGVDPLIVIWSHAPTLAMPPMMTFAPPPQQTQPVPAGGQDSALLEQMAYYWTGVLQIESDLRRVRMQLEQAVSRLSSLNRDLSSDEAGAADNNDKKDWQDARRWLREGAGGLSRSIKEIDVGVLSGAGQRHRFEDMYKQFVQPRIPFAGMAQAAIDFEMFHKSAKNVLQAAQSALAKGSAEGERRANAVLHRINAKVRARRSKQRGGG